MNAEHRKPPGSVPPFPPANDPYAAPANEALAHDDVREQLRRDHDEALAELQALGAERDEQRALSRLRHLRQIWVIHALAEETVIYRVLENVASSERADERFVEHELVGGLFDKMTRLRPGSREWTARLTVVRDLIQRHIDFEHEEIFAALARQFDEEGLRELGGRFRLAHDKLLLLERAKAA